MFITKHRKIFFSISIILITLSIVSVFVFGLKPGIDFTGGSVLEVEYTTERPLQSEVELALGQLNFGDILVRETGDMGYIIKTKVIDDSTKEEIKTILGFENKFSLEEKRFNTVGSTLGNELKTRTAAAMVVVILAIITFIAYTFRHVSKPVSSWGYGLVAIIALVHDVIITIGFFAVLGYLYGTELNTLFITALLVILGYSINDTIIVLDRVRENLRNQDDNQRVHKFEETVGRSLSETFTRSINTSFTTILALLALFLLGGESTKDFALALVVGIIAGSYSSIFIAAPLLVVFKNRQKVVK